MKLSDDLKEIGHPVAYYPRIALFLETKTVPAKKRESKPGIKTAILFCQLLYWDKHSHGKEFWITSPAITLQTGLSYEEQLSARKHLLRLGYIEEHTAKLEHRIYVKINKEAFSHDFSKWVKSENTPISPTSGKTPDVDWQKSRRDSQQTQTTTGKNQDDITETTAKNNSRTTSIEYQGRDVPVVPSIDANILGKGLPSLSPAPHSPDALVQPEPSKRSAEGEGSGLGSAPETSGPEITLTPAMLLTTVESACRREAKSSGVRCFTRSEADWTIAQKLYEKVYMASLTLGDVVELLRLYFKSKTNDPKYFTLTAFETFADAHWQLAKTKAKQKPAPELPRIEPSPYIPPTPAQIEAQRRIEAQRAASSDAQEREYLELKTLWESLTATIARNQPNLRIDRYCRDDAISLRQINRKLGGNAKAISEFADFLAEKYDNRGWLRPMDAHFDTYYDRFLASRRPVSNTPPEVSEPIPAKR